MGRVEIRKSVRMSVLDRDGYTCQYCGRKAPDVALEIDHVIPVSKGGTNDIDNLVTACYDCNRGKSDRMLKGNKKLVKKASDAVSKSTIKTGTEVEKIVVRITKENLLMLKELSKKTGKNRSDLVREIISKYKGDVGESSEEKRLKELLRKEKLARECCERELRACERKLKSCERWLEESERRERIANERADIYKKLRDENYSLFFEEIEERNSLTIALAETRSKKTKALYNLAKLSRKSDYIISAASQAIKNEKKAISVLSEGKLSRRQVKKELEHLRRSTRESILSLKGDFL